MEKTREYSKNPAAVRARLKRWHARGGARIFVPDGGEEASLFGNIPTGKVIQQRPPTKPRAKRRTIQIGLQPELFSEESIQ